MKRNKIIDYPPGMIRPDTIVNLIGDYDVGVRFKHRTLLSITARV